MTEPNDPRERKLYFVDYSDEDGPMGAFITATTPEEAFELYRLAMSINPEDYTHNDREAYVHAVPAVADRPGTHAWDNITSDIFPLSFESLATRAVRATEPR